MYLKAVDHLRTDPKRITKRIERDRVNGEKKVKPLGLASSKPKKKNAKGRGAAETKPGSRPKILRVVLVLGLATATVFLAFPMPEAYNLSLLLGDIADQDVRAERDFMVLDSIATTKKREEARLKSPTVFDLDDRTALVVQEQLHRLLARGREILEAPPVTSPIFESYTDVSQPSPAELAELKQSFFSVTQLDPKENSFEIIRAAGFTIRIERAIFQLIIDILNQGIVVEKGVLLAQPNIGITIRRIHSQQEDFVPYAAVFPSLDEARRTVRERALLLINDFEPAQTRAIVNVALSLLRPNLIMNSQETEQRRQAAEAAVGELFIQVKAGEKIVREGEKVDMVARMKLEAQALAVEQNWTSRAVGFFILTIVFLVVTYSVCFRFIRGFRLKERDLLFLATLLLLNLLLAFIAVQVGDAMNRGWPGLNKPTILFLAPLAGAGMLVTIFLGPLPAIFFSIIAAGLDALVFERSLGMFFYCLLGSIAGLAGVVRVRERSAITKSGFVVSLVNIVVILGLGLIDRTLWSKGVAFSLAAGLLSGSLAGILVAGLIPAFEMIFKYTTDIKLLELANLDRPILRELMVQAPGTYHHSVIVGAMVEAAAEAIGANPLLAKVSAYYHDLGKMKKPLYFVENQGYGDNKHEKLAPSMSSLILISHIKDGAELARKHKLSPEIVDIVQQHHGTSLIAFFYKKAQDGRTPDQPEINIEDYRYPGPKPQTREAGLVMLADAVEAASRSLNEPSPSRILGTVQKLINNIFSDGQLDECELTLKDLHLIASSFNKILSGIYHRRISYPEPASKDTPVKVKAANGNHARQSAKDTADQDKAAQSKRKEDLRRLGIS